MGARARIIRVVVIVVVLCLLATVGGVAWFELRAVPVREDLIGAGALLRQLEQQVESGRTGPSQSTLDSLRARTAAARAGTRSLDWWLAGALPLVGDDVDAVRTIAEVLDDLATGALPSVVRLAGTLSLPDLVPRDGRVELGPLRAVAPDIEAVAGRISILRDRVDNVATAGLTHQVSEAVDQVRAGLDRLAALSATAARAAALLPAMLGLDGPRTYLVLFQNSAEVRATGGMPGAFVVVRADRGAISIVDQGSSASALGTFTTPVLPLDAWTRSLYTDRLGIFPGDVNLTPHFPTAARLAREMYRRRTGRTVDGVLATDPIALSYLLRATGPVVTAAGATLTADNAVQVLLVDAYRRMSTTPQKDAYFAAAARAVFETLSRGAANPAGAVAALARAAGERRLLVWSAHPDDQESIAGTVLEGAMPLSDGAAPQVGIFLNDGTGAKLDVYLTHSAALQVTGCRPDGRVELTVGVSLGSRAPSTGLPPYVLGLALGGSPYTIRTNVMFFSPAGGSILTADKDGSPITLGTGMERGRTVGITTVLLKPGQTSSLRVRLLTAALTADERGRLSPSLWVTPGVNPWPLVSPTPVLCE